MDWPPHRGLIRIVEHSCAPHHVVEDVESADRLTITVPLLADIVDLADLDRGDVAVLRESRRNTRLR